MSDRTQIYIHTYNTVQTHNVAAATNFDIELIIILIIFTAMGATEA